MRIAYDGCPLCGGAGEVLRVEQSWVRGEIQCDLTWVRCVACGHVHTSHYFDNDDTAKMLATVSEDGIFGGNLDMQRFMWGQVIDRITPHIKKPGRWVDVGVGNGSLLFTAAEFGFDAVGIDTRPYILEPLRKFGYAVEEADALEYDYSGSAVVVLADILEHMPHPKELLSRIREKLDGALLVSCPNMDSVAWKYLETTGGPVYWKEPEHYHNFTRASLQRLLRECGFTPVSFSISSRYQAGMEIIAI